MPKSPSLVKQQNPKCDLGYIYIYIVCLAAVYYNKPGKKTLENNLCVCVDAHLVTRNNTDTCARQESSFIFCI